ncbi:f-box domain-containing protein [Fusarium coicis]|nr:f-box domain-containing protein [Fusarium coicis]
MLLIPRQHAGPVGRAFEPELNRPSYSHQKKYASSCPTWLPKVLQTTKLSLLERLPNDVQRLIFSDLDYQSLIFLSMVNRHFHRTVDPQRIATLRDKFELVMRAAKDFPQHWASEKKKDQRPGNLECYWCFRVRSPQHFDVLQANTAYFDPQGRLIPEQEAGPQDWLMPLRRFCIGCGVWTSGFADADVCGRNPTACSVQTALQLVHCGPKEGGVAVTIRPRDPSIVSYCIRESR